MGKLDKVFAVGAIAAALVVGGVLYALYPSGFTTSYASENGATSTASSAYDVGGTEQTAMSIQDNNTAGQDSPDAYANNASKPQPDPEPSNIPTY